MLNQAQVANMLGITARMVRVHVTNGVLPPMPEGGYSGPGLVNAWIKFKSQPRVPKDRLTEKIDIANERALREQAERKMAEIKLSKESGRLIDIDEVSNAIETVLTIHRNKLLSLGQINALQILALKTPEEVSQFLTKQIRLQLMEVTSELASTLEVGISTGTDSTT